MVAAFKVVNEALPQALTLKEIDRFALFLCTRVVDARYCYHPYDSTLAHSARLLMGYDAHGQVTEEMRQAYLVPVIDSVLLDCNRSNRVKMSPSSMRKVADRTVDVVETLEGVVEEFKRATSTNTLGKHTLSAMCHKVGHAIRARQGVVPDVAMTCRTLTISDELLSAYLTPDMRRELAKLIVCGSKPDSYYIAGFKTSLPGDRRTWEHVNAAKFSEGMREMGARYYVDLGKLIVTNNTNLAMHWTEVELLQVEGYIKLMGGLKEFLRD